MLINISSAFIHNRQIGFLANVFRIFQQQKALIKAVGIKRPSQDIWHKTFDINSILSQNTV